MVYVILWLMCGLIAGLIGSSTGHGCVSFFLGILLGPIGIIIVLFGNKQEKEIAKEKEKLSLKTCPFCAEQIKREAIVCRYCGKDLPVESKLTSQTAFAIKENPFTGSRLIATLPENTPYQIIREEPEWIKIEFYDSQEQMSVEGWVEKANLGNVEQ